MGERAPAERTRKVDADAAAAEVAEHYARILGRHADRQVVDVVRVCLRRLPSRLPIHGEDLRAVEVLIERVLRLGEVGTRDPFGSPRQIDDYIARRLGLPACGPRTVYRALRAMLGRTVLVERHSRQIWSLHLSGLTDPSSAIHRALLAETPAPYTLPPPETNHAAGSADPPGPSPPREADATDHLRQELARLHEQMVAEQAARLVAEEQQTAAEEELGRVRRALDEVRPAVARVAELEQEIRTLSRALEEERAARTKAMLVHATLQSELEHEYRPIRLSLDEERRARGEAEQRVQIATAQLIEFKEKYIAALREHCAELQSVRAEMVHLARDAQIADAAHVWRLIEAGRSQDALTFIAARMQGLDVEVSEGPTPTSPAAEVPGTTELRGNPSLGDSAEPLLPSAATTLPAASRAPPIPSRATTSGSPAKIPRLPTVHAPAMVLPVDPDQNRQGAHEKPGKIGRNDPCPCGSGNKYKRCCGRLG